MNQKTKQKLFTLLYVFLIICLIAFMIFMIFWLKGQGKSCMDDPLKWIEDQNKDAICSCYKQGEMFGITDTNIHAIEQEMKGNN